MRNAATSARGGGRFSLALTCWLFALCLPANAQLFDGLLSPRPPADIPNLSRAPAETLAAPDGGVEPAPKGPTLQSLPPPAARPPATTQSAPAMPSGQVALALSARFGPNMPAITGGLQWRIYPEKPEPGGGFRLIKEEKSPAPVFALPPGNYVIYAGFGLASATKVVELRAGQPLREVLDIQAGGLRLEGKVGDIRIPHGQISFDLYRGSQFEPGDKRPIVQGAQSGDVILVPDGTYHIVSNYGDANATVRSDIRIQAGKLIDATVTHRAAVITLKLVNQHGGEARANTQWSVLTPGGDVVKEAIGAFPRVILAEGDYRAIARNDDKTYERAFKVITGVDGEVEVLAQ
jgi:hypothetical protein